MIIQVIIYVNLQIVNDVLCDYHSDIVCRICSDYDEDGGCMDFLLINMET